MAGICQFPGCTRPTKSTKESCWLCAECKLLMNRSRAARRIGCAARETTQLDKATRKAVDPFGHRVDSRSKHETSEPRIAEPKCKECFGMPWARVRDRSNSRDGASSSSAPPVAGIDGLCRGCGLPWAPEPRAELCGTIRSSAAMCLDQGRLDGHAREFHGRSANGTRKAKK